MPVYSLSEQLIFPPPSHASPDGLLAIGGDLSPRRLLIAYQMGIFPWFNDDEPILWWSPNPRCVLFLDDLKISKSLRQVLRNQKFKITFDHSFEEVIRACQAPRKGQDGTWITEDIIEAYCQIHEMGFAHSVEVWYNDELAGGLYGISLGDMFFGESMFTRVSNASKVALVNLVELCKKWNFSLIDCQIYNEHLGSLGASEIPRSQFLNMLGAALEKPTFKGKWR